MSIIIGHHDAMKCKKSVEPVTEKVEPTQRNTPQGCGHGPRLRDEDAQLMNNADGMKMIAEMAATRGTALVWKSETSEWKSQQFSVS